jgi:hypothetical protein
MTPKERELHWMWLCGVLDIKARWNAQHSTITVSTGNEALGLAVADLLGVSMVAVEGVVGGFDRKGCTTHCPTQHVHINPRTSYRVRVTGIAAVIVAVNLLPGLRGAAGQAQALVQSYLAGTRANSGKVTTVVDRMARLGWDVPEWAR